LSRPVEQSIAGCLIYSTRWRAISLDFVALWRSFCLAILRRFLESHRENLLEEFIRQDVEWGLTGDD
jgi:hypothetical protein